MKSSTSARVDGSICTILRLVAAITAVHLPALVAGEAPSPWDALLPEVLKSPVPVVVSMNPLRGSEAPREALRRPSPSGPAAAAPLVGLIAPRIQGVVRDAQGGPLLVWANTLLSPGQSLPASKGPGGGDGRVVQLKSIGAESVVFIVRPKPGAAETAVELAVPLPSFFREP